MLVAGPLAMAVLTAVEAISLGVAHKASTLSCWGGASAMRLSVGVVMLSELGPCMF